MKNKINSFQSLLIFLFVLLVGMGAFLSTYYNLSLGKALAKAQEESRPAELIINWLTDENCSQCFDFAMLLDQLKENQNLNIEVEKYDWQSKTGQQIIADNNIGKLPTLVISGETKRKKVLQQWESYGRWQEDKFIFTGIRPPYREVVSGKIRGEVDLIYIDKDNCEECYDVRLHDNILARFGLIPQKKEVIDVDSEAGKVIVEQYSIENVPTIVLQGDLEVFTQLMEVWDYVGLVAEDGSYILHDISKMGKYWSLTEDKLMEKEE